MQGYPAMMNLTNCVRIHTTGMDHRKLGKSARDHELGEIECVFRIMR